MWMRRVHVMDLIRQGWMLGCMVGKAEPYFIRKGEVSLEVPTDVVVGLVVDGFIESDKRQPVRYYNPTKLGRVRYGFPPIEEHATEVVKTEEPEPGDVE